MYLYYTVDVIIIPAWYVVECMSISSNLIATEAFGFYRVMHYRPTCIVQISAVLRSHVVRLSVCNVGGSGSHSYLEHNCTDN